MVKAIRSVVDGENGLKRASEAFGVPRSTLQRHIRIYRKNPDMELAIEKGEINWDILSEILDVLCNLII